MLKADCGIIIVRVEDMTDRTGQTMNLPRMEGVSPARTSSNGLWMGRATAPPGKDSGAHHHGEAETGGYVLSGHCRVYFGQGYREYFDMGPGDFAYVPPFVPHIERNLSATEPVEFVTCRFPGNVVVNLDDMPEDLP